MRQIYTSPREQNIDHVVALFAEQGIETTVTNRSRWNPRSYQRFSYTQKQDSRDEWPQVWVTHAEDYPRARALLREIGIDPVVRYAEELAAVRQPNSVTRPRSTPNMIRRLLIIAVLVVAAYQVLHLYLHLF